MPWQMQVEHRGVRGDWRPVGVKSFEPYRYDTREEAARMLEMCYPDQCREARLAGDHEYTGRAGSVRVVQE